MAEKVTPRENVIPHIGIWKTDSSLILFAQSARETGSVYDRLRRKWAIMKELLVHLGLPKTATTSMQKHLFADVSNPSTLYIGVQQPRVRDQHPYYNELVSYLRGQIEADEMSMLNGEHKRYILSEEMIMIDEGKATWQSKLDRIAELQSFMQVKVLIVTREEKSLLNSLYVELYHSLTSIDYCLEKFKKSNQALICNRETVMSQLSGKIADVSVIDFSEVSKPSFVKKVEAFSGCEYKYEILPRENVKARRGEYVYTHGVSLYNLMYKNRRLRKMLVPMPVGIIVLLHAFIIPGSKKKIKLENWSSLDYA